MTLGRIAFIGLLLALAAFCFMRAAALVNHGVFRDHASDRPTATAAGITSANLPTADEMQMLLQRRLLIPVEGVDRNKLRDNFDEMRSGIRHHDALDIMAPRGTPVLAADRGRIAKLAHGGPGGNTIYEYDRNARYAYYYAHLDRYADGLHEGDSVGRGDVIGYVGTTGNATLDAPHLHFTIYKLGDSGRLWGGQAFNPYPFLVESRP